MIGNLILIYPCCWCSHGYGRVAGLCRISPVLLSPGKQRQEGELEIYLYSTAWNPNRRGRGLLPGFPLPFMHGGDKSSSFHFFPFLPPQFSSKVLQKKSRNGSLNRIFSQGFQCPAARPPSATPNARCCANQGGRVLHLHSRAWHVSATGSHRGPRASIPTCGKSIPPALP